MPNYNETGFDKISLLRGTKQELIDNKDKMNEYEVGIAKDTQQLVYKENDKIVTLNGKVATYDTIEDLKNANLKVGEVVEVLGYYSKDDGATHKRVISDTDDGSGILLDNGKYANIIHNRDINVSWVGAKGDGITDDTEAIQKAINIVSPEIYSGIQGGIIRFNIGKYIISKTIHIGGYCSLIGEAYGNWSGKEGLKICSQIHYVGDSNNGAIHFTPYIRATKQRFLDDSFSERLSDQDTQSARFIFRPTNAIVENIRVTQENGGKFALRLSGADTCRVNKFSCAGFEYGIIGEANWESGFKNINFEGIIKYGYAGYSGQHSIHFDNIWPIGKNKYQDLGYSPTGFYLEWGAGCTFTAISCEVLRTGFHFFKCDGMNILGGQMESVFGLVYASSSSVNFIGGDLWNPKLDYFNDSYIVSGARSECNFINLKTNHPYYDTPSLQQGRWVDKDKFGDYATLNVNVVGEKPTEKDKADPLNTNINWVKSGDEIRNFDIKNTTTLKNKFEEAYTTKDGKTIYHRYSGGKYSIGTSGGSAFTFDPTKRSFKLYEIEMTQYWGSDPQIAERPRGSLGVDNQSLDLYIIGGGKRINFMKQTLATQLDTPYMTTKMKDEGVYNDFMTYMDDDIKYRNMEKSKREALAKRYELALKNNPNLTYEEFMAKQPMSFIAIPEPKPSKALLEFAKKYL